MVPRRDFGLVNDPAFFLIYLNMHEADWTPEECDAAAWDFWMLVVKRIGQPVVSRIAMTTKRPDLYPGAYGEIRIVPSLYYTRDDFPPAGAAEVSKARWRDMIRDRDDNSAVLVSDEKTGKNRHARSEQIYHGGVHAVCGYDHADGEPWSPKVRVRWLGPEGVKLCVRSSARFRTPLLVV